MALAARRIQVVVEGQTSELQAALSKAVEGLKGLAETVAKQARESVAYNDRTIKSNEAVAESYAATADGVKRSSLIVVESLRTQMAAQDGVATHAARSAREQVTAGEESVKASQGAAQAAVAAADAQIAASRDTGAAAARSADEQVVAAGKVNAAHRKNAESGAAASSAQTKGFAASGGALARWGKLSIATMAAVAAASVFGAAKYEKATTQYVTQAGASVKASQQISRGILRMAGEVAGTPDQLAGGMYHVVSSMNNLIPPTQRVSTELGVLRESAKLAKIGGSDLTETAYVLSSVMNALGEHSIPAARRAAAELNAIVGSGDMHMQDLVGAMSTGIVPAVQTFGVSLHSVGAALAYMTDRGVPAQQAATRLRMAITMMGAPTKMASKLLRDVGLSSSEVIARQSAMRELLEESGLHITRLASDLRQPDGILVALHDLKTSMTEAGVTAQGQAALIARAFGGAKSGSTIEALFEHPEILEAKYKQQARIIHQYGSDWERTKQTVTFQAQAMIASIESLGIRLGQVLAPSAVIAMNALSDVASWFAHNEAAALALGATITGVVGVAITAFIASKLMKLVEALKQVNAASEYLRNGFRRNAAVAAEQGAANVVAGAGASSPLMGGPGGVRGLIGGARSGLGLPGSVMNPIVVAIEAGQYAGLGGQGAAGTVVGASASEEKALASEARGGAAAAGSAGVATAEEAALAGGVMNTVRKGLGTMLDRAMKGGMVAAIGTLVSQIVGSAIGGHTGKEVAGIGSTAALGAAIGTAIEPGIGTAIGGALGGVGSLLAHLLHGGNTGAEVAKRSAAGMGSDVEQQLADSINHATGRASKAIHSIEESGRDWEEKAAKFLHDTFGLDFAGEEKRVLTSVQKAEKREVEERKNAELFGAGKRFGGTMVKQELSATKGMSSFAQVTAVITDIEKRFKGLPPAAQKGAFESIMAVVKEYQKDGRLPPTAVEEVLHTIEGKFPSLKQAFAMAGGESLQALNGALKGQEVLSGVEGIVNQWRNVFPKLPHIVGLNLNNAVEVFKKVNGELGQLAHTGPESQRQAASEAYKKMQQEEVRYFATMRGGIEGEIKHLSSRMGPLASGGTTALETAYERMRATIQQEVAAGVKATSKGTKEINSILTHELKTLGIGSPSKANQAFGPMPGGGSNPLQETGTGGSSGFTGLGAARGALLQLGRPGEAGKDSIPFMAGNVPVIAAPGEQVAVFTREQQAVANAHLSKIGGLKGLFSRHRKPNHMATGGFVAEPGTDFSVGKEPQIVGDLRKLAALMKTTIYGISGYRSPSHSVSVGGFANDPHTRGEAADIGVGSPTLASAARLTAGLLARVGLERPFYPADAHEINHVQLLGSGGAGGARGSVAGRFANAAALLKAIKTPKVAGRSVFAAMARAALATITKGANAQLAGAGGLGSMAGVKGKGGSPSANERLGHAMMLAAGYPANEWSSLQALWTQESGWDANSVNPSSGAYGIPQALGHGHPYNLGDARAQIEWGLRYIKQRYGSPTVAEAHERAYHWYARGGLLHMARGGVAKDASRVSHSVAQKIKSTILKGKGTKPKLSKGDASSKIGKGLGKLTGVAGLAEVPGLAAKAFDHPLEALSNQEGLLDQMSGDAHGFFVLPGDMTFLQPTLQAGESIAAGMNVLDAQNVNRAFLAKNGESEPLKLQQEILSWIAGQASHRLLTGSDVGIISGTFGPAGLSFKAGEPLLGAELANLKKQLILMGAYGGSGTELPWLEGLSKRIGEAHDARHKRNEHIRHVEEKAFARYTKLKAQIRDLTTGSLKERVAAAKDAYAEKVRAYDADEHRRALKDAIAEEKRVPKAHRDQALIQQHEKELSEIHVPKRLSGTSIKDAEIALLKNELGNELHPIEDTLKRFGGSTTTIGTGGLYGKIATEARTLTEKGGEVEQMLETLRTSKIPGAKMSLRSVQEAMQDAPVPVPVKSAGSGENTMLTQLLEQQNRILATNYRVSQAQFAVFSQFLTGGIPKYERGGLVRNTGLALVHQGEWITPNPKGPYGSQMAAHPAGGPRVVVETHHHVHGELGPLIDLIDTRVRHPRNVEVVSKTIQRRTRGNPAFR